MCFQARFHFIRILVFVIPAPSTVSEQCAGMGGLNSGCGEKGIPSPLGYLVQQVQPLHVGFLRVQELLGNVEQLLWVGALHREGKPLNWGGAPNKVTHSTPGSSGDREQKEAPGFQMWYLVLLDAISKTNL